ncbi:MAG: protein tyrosine phosphatase family protein [Pseudomonadota bacterium]
MITNASRLALTVGLLLMSMHGFAELGEIHNYHEVNDRLSTGGHVMAPQVPELKDAGFELVVNLATVQEDHNASDGPSLAAEGIAYVHIPVLWSSPTLDDLDLFFAIMDARADRKTLVHCMANYRASAFVYLYRTLRQGVPEAQARRDLEVIWNDQAWREYPQWAALMEAAQARAK